MRLVPELAMIFSSVCVFSFLVSEMGFSQIPILYPIGVWLHEYWFADYHERYKRNYGNYAIDGPPLIAVPGDGGPQNWPYAAAAPNTIPLQYTDQYADVAHSSSKYTPVDGVGGVVKGAIKQNNGSVLYCFPQAQEPNDYIANRFLGKGFGGSYANLVNVGETGKAETEYNKNVFKDGSPFVMAAIGKGFPNDPRWGSRPKYSSTNPAQQLLVPLTTTNTGPINQNPQVTGVFQPNRDYSGGEYAISDPNSLESQSLTGTSRRPPWYRQDYEANFIDPKHESGNSGAWVGDDPYITYTQNQDYGYEYAMPEFTTPIGAGGPHGVTGWGEPVSGLHADPSPRDMQYNFIETQLMQENPISIK